MLETIPYHFWSNSIYVVIVAKVQLEGDGLCFLWVSIINIYIAMLLNACVKHCQSSKIWGHIKKKGHQLVAKDHYGHPWQASALRTTLEHAHKVQAVRACSASSHSAREKVFLLLWWKEWTFDGSGYKFVFWGLIQQCNPHISPWWLGSMQVATSL